ncbi:hypothetical protein LPJ81_002443, partial [Coemansia sp. IMI 209127]
QHMQAGSAAASLTPGQGSPVMSTAMQGSSGVAGHGFPTSMPLGGQMNVHMAAGQQQNMSPVLSQQGAVMSPLLNSQSNTPRPPQVHTPMQLPMQMAQQRPQQQTPQAMMLAAAAAAGLSSTAAQALIAQVAATSDISQQQPMELSSPAHVDISSVNAAVAGMAMVSTPAAGANTTSLGASEANSGGNVWPPSTPSASQLQNAAGSSIQGAAVQPQSARTPPSQQAKEPSTPGARAATPRPATTGTPNSGQTPQQPSGSGTPTSAQHSRRPPHLNLKQGTPSTGSGSASAKEGSAGATPSAPVSRASTPSIQQGSKGTATGGGGADAGLASAPVASSGNAAARPSSNNAGQKDEEPSAPDLRKRSSGSSGPK